MIAELREDRSRGQERLESAAPRAGTSFPAVGRWVAPAPGPGMKILHHEIIGHGPAAGWLYVLHGVFGAGRNWGTVARSLTRVRPDWGVVLVDLREHGASRGFPPPHTVSAAARDLAGLAVATGLRSRALLGHSFGGKVALSRAADGPEGLEQVWVIDSTPEAAPPAGSAWRMLQAVKRLPDRFASREPLIRSLEADGFEPAVAQWMATNLERADGGFRWRFERGAVESLIRDFFATDLWPVVEALPASIEIRFVKATASAVLSAAAVARIRDASQRARVRLDELAGGHWLNADNPEGLVELLRRGLPAA